MNSHTELMPNKPAVSTATFKQKLSTISYLTAVTVAMVGWLSAFGWVAVVVAKWLLGLIQVFFSLSHNQS
jgi:hypothetical protein